ncbi:uncharacterized protein [Spinacia oleracea]|uniref:Uncharacterized protein n=1 Tax=Spinacia oleracea TaxID=3562 RepID=A0ABM3RBD5_SPIOL|nr:uncharacterized protein LOC130467910 [Spinacia oleracea]
MNHKLNEDCDGEVSSSSKSQPDDSDDEDFKADGFDDEDDVVVQTVGRSIKSKRGRPKATKKKECVTTKRRAVVEKVTLRTGVFKDSSFSKGGQVKEVRQVLKVLHREYNGRVSNLICY